MVKWLLTYRMLLMLLFCSIGTRAQLPFALKHWDKSQGLPSNQIYCFQQDQNGYLWMGTDHGLSRFDGEEFVNFSSADGLLHNTVYKIIAHQKKFWLLHLSGGLTVLDTEQLTFSQPQAGTAIQEVVKSSRIRDLIFTSKNQAFFTTLPLDCEQTPLYYSFELNNTQIQEHPFPFSVDEACANHLLKIENQWLEYGIEQNISYPVTINPSNIIVDKQRISIDQASAAAVLGLKTPNNFVCYNFKGIWKYNNYQLLDSVKFDLGQLHNLRSIDDTTFLLLTEKGLYQYSFITKKLDTLSLLNHVSNIFIDQDQNLWIATLYNGVFMYNSIKRKLSNSFKSYLVNDKITQIKPSAQSLWGLSEKGDLLNFENGGLRQQIQLPIAQKRTYHAFAIGDDQQIYTNNGVQYHPTTQEIRLFRDSLYLYVYDMLCLGDSILFAHGNGIILYTSDKEENFMDGHSRVYAFQKISDAKIFVGLDNGIASLNDGKVRIDKLAPRFRVADLLYIKEEGLILMGTHGNGIWYSSVSNPKWLPLKNVIQVSSAFIKAMDYEYENGKLILWLATNIGLTKLMLNTQKKMIQHYSLSLNDFPELKDINDVKVHENWLFIATNKGLLQIEKSAIADVSTRKDGVLIKEIKVNGKTIPSVKDLVFNFDENNLEITLLPGELFNHNQRTYYFKFEAEQDWHLSKSSEILFRDLAPGSYTLQFRTSNIDSPQFPITTVQFTISPHFTQTLWFRSTAILLLVLIVGLLIRYISYINRAKVHYQKARYYALRNQINPHFIFNAMNMLSYYIYKKMTDAAGTYLGDFSALLRGILNNSEKDFILLSDEIEVMQSYLKMESGAGDFKQFDYELTIREDLVLKAWQIPPMLLQPLVENAIMHGLQPKKEGPKKLKILLKKDAADQLLISVIDNGIGRQASKAINEKRQRYKDKPFSGLKNIKDRIQSINLLFNQQIELTIIDIFDDEGQAAGTQVNLLLPRISAPKVN